MTPAQAKAELARRRAHKGSYQAHKDRVSKRQAAATLSHQNIGPPPACKDPARREACRLDFALALETYFRRPTWKPWSEAHKESFTTGQRVTLDGGKSVKAHPRGFAKTTVAEFLAIWAMLNNHRQFIAILGKNATSSEETLLSIKTEIETNELLYDDFPEIIHPVRELEGEGRRAPGQHIDGLRTQIVWRKRKIVLPTVKGSPVSGNVFRCCGLTASEVRGMRHKRPDGEILRPSMVIIDDPQDSKSALSPLQTGRLERLIMADVLGMAGRGREIAAFMLVTCQQPDDLAERMLLKPDWQGERVSLVRAFPTAAARWDEYRGIKEEAERKKQGIEPATAFYLQHQSEMDAGADLTWPDMPISQGEASAVQNAMNLLYQDEPAFWSEQQNQPRPPKSAGELVQLDKGQLAERINQHERRLLPKNTSCLTVGVDVQKKLLYWVACAWSEGFGGAIVDYGVWPGQARTYFAMNDAAPTIQQATRINGEDGSVYAALACLENELLGKPWNVDGGGTMHVSRALVDSGWLSHVVDRFCRESRQGAILQPSKGLPISASKSPIEEWPKREGEKRGLNWLIRATERRTRLLMFDANAWKTHVCERLLVPMGERSALTLFGKEARQHALLLDHLTSEHRVETEGRGRRLEEWTLKPARENHWWDALVMAAVAASERGITVMGAETMTGQLTFGHLMGGKNANRRRPGTR